MHRTHTAGELTAKNIGQTTMLIKESTIFLFVLILGFIIFPSVHAEVQNISQSEISIILSGAISEGSTGATITLIEYSDMECPFCIMLHNEIQLWKKIKEKYGNNVNYVFKNNRGVNHFKTEKKALSALCIKRLGGDNSYIKFYNEVLRLSTRKLYSVTRIPIFLRKQRISVSKFNICIKDPVIMDQFDLETKEAQKYNLSGTPGIIVLNTKTKKYVIVEGAYPIETFYNAVDELLK